MQIRVLGSVDVELDGALVKLAGPKQRAVLSMLALNANEVVSLERLIDGLWGDEPPATAAKMVQQYVSQLRRALAEQGGSEIVTRGRGYELCIDPGAVDALRFERLLDRACAESDGHRGDLAREALALWRGAPLSGMLEEPFAATEARRLEDLHLAAVELALEGDLQAGRHTEVAGRLATLVDEHPLRERLRALLMLALYRGGRQAEALEAFQDARWTLVEKLGLEPGPELRRLQEAILRQDPALDLVVPDATWANRETAEQVGTGAGRASRQRTELRAIEDELAAKVVDLRALRARAARREPRPATCPFKGLESFDVTDADVFFGRERLVAEIIARLPGTSLLGVIGPSGSGKSSAVRAGVLPALADGTLPGSERWTRALLRPGDRPLAALRRAAGVPADTGDPLAAAVARIGRDARLLVVVDQFEELFTTCRDPVERAAFVDALVAGHERVLVVLALRADFYGACAQHPRLARLLGENHVLVGPMRADELAQAIAEPAAQGGLEVEPELVDRLVAETAGQTGGLPLLSTTLLELWQRRTGNRLTMRSYERGGGVRGAVARLAETAYERLTPAEAATARNILVRLAGEADADVAVRRQVPLSELDLGRGGPARRVLDILTENRLLTVGGETVEVAHEALLREWPRLRGWLEQDAEARRLHRHITVAARDWDAGGRDTGELYRGARLASALDFAADHDEALNELERAFLDEARLVSEGEAERSRRMNRRLGGLLAGALAALLLAGVAALLALDQRGDARAAATIADAQRLGAEALTDDRLDRALLLARTGVELDDSVATRGNLFATLTRVQPGSLGVIPDVRDAEIYSVAIHPRGDQVAIGDAFGEVRTFDLATRRQLASYRIDPGLVQRLAYSPDGATLAVTALDTSGERLDAGVVAGNAPSVDPPPPTLVLDLLDARSLERRRRVVLPELPKATDFVGASPEFTADGRLAVLQIPFPDNQLRVLRLVDPDSGEIAPRAFRFRGGTLDPVMTGDRRHVLVSGNDTTYELDASDLRLLARHPAGGDTLRLSPDGRTLALGGADGSVRLLDLGTEQIRPLAGRHTALVLRLAFTPDGKTLASVAEDGKLLLWDVAAGRLRERLDAQQESAEALAITPDGRTAITSGTDGRVALWDLAGDRRLQQTLEVREPYEVDNFTPRGVAVSADDKTLAIAESDGGVDIVDATTLQRREVLQTGDDPALAVAYSPDGRLLAVTGARGQVGLWDAHSLEPVSTLPGLSGWTQAATFSPDGRLLAAAEASTARPQARIWDVRTRTALPFRSDVLTVSALEFSPDGRLLALAGGAEGVEVREVRSGRAVTRIRGDELARTVAFSPDGRLLFAGYYNGAGQLYSTSDWKPIGGRFRGQDQRLLSGDFTPDGRTLMTASADGTILLWDVATRRPIGSPVIIERENYIGAALSRDGAYAYAIPMGKDGARVALTPEAWKRHACAIAGRPLTRREWAEALPGRDYRPICAPAR